MALAVKGNGTDAVRYTKSQDVLAVAYRVAEETSALLVHSEGIQTELRRDIMEGQRIEKALFEEKERLRVTLSCIGDAVITTDKSGKVTYLNPVAETMTGWNSKEASGLSLPEVFHIINAKTREPAPNPVERVLQGDKSVGLAVDTVLMQRGGTPFPIEDSVCADTGFTGGPNRRRAGIP